METRADYVLIGTFTVSLIVGVFLFVLWLAQVEIDREWSEYDIIFDTTITGLSESGDVRFSGIKVGEVKRLSIDPKDPARVIARIRIDATTPVSTDSKATLEFQGLTGVAYILLLGGAVESPPLQPGAGEEVPTIVAEASGIQELFASAPDVLSGANRLILQAEEILGPKNRDHISNILSDVETLTDSVAKQDEEIREIILNLRTLSKDLASISGNINTMSANLSELSVTANTMLEKDGQKIINEATQAVTQVRNLAANANGVVEDNRASIRAFADGGLAQFGQFVVEGRQLVRTLDRVLQRLESDPARYLSGNYAAEYESE